VEVALAEAEDLELEVVVLVGLADPLQPDAAGGGETAGVAGTYDGEDLVLAAAEGVVGEGVTGFGGEALAPGGWRELPGDLEILAQRWHRQHRAGADHSAGRDLLDGPAAGGPR